MLSIKDDIYISVFFKLQIPNYGITTKINASMPIHTYSFFRVRQFSDLNICWMIILKTFYFILSRNFGIMK